MRKGNGMVKGKFNGKSFGVNSSQSSTGTNSPATTIMANYQNMYKTPPPTPPMQNPNFGYGAGYMPAVLFRQVNVILERPFKS